MVIYKFNIQFYFSISVSYAIFATSDSPHSDYNKCNIRQENFVVAD